ncbi:MAG: enoyl-CoA hydratase-related protein [Hyphomonadaceae bacterium]|nr:enoyl-CoA hydratase-related protein [Hyphomonadaceae bacterium]
MSEAPTLYELRHGAAWITLNAPERRNALNDALIASLSDHVRRALADDGARCIVLTGAGKAFCAGADLKGVAATAPEEPSPFVRLLTDLLHAPKPVIAAVNGVAFAGGLGLVAAADIAIAVETVTFSFSEVRIGVIPAIIGVVCVPRIGAARAMQLFLTGETFDAAAAAAYGLIHRTAPVGGLEAAVQADVDMIGRGGPRALAEAKALVRRLAAQDLETAFAWTQARSFALFASEEGQEGMAAFREKRSPRWVSGGGGNEAGRPLAPPPRPSSVDGD